MSSISTFCEARCHCTGHETGRGRGLPWNCRSMNACMLDRIGMVSSDPDPAESFSLLIRCHFVSAESRVCVDLRVFACILSSIQTFDWALRRPVAIAKSLTGKDGLSQRSNCCPLGQTSLHSCTKLGHLGNDVR